MANCSQMNSCFINHDKNLKIETCDACIELIIRILGVDYGVVLMKDGRVIDQKTLATQQQVVTWVHAIARVVGQNLYVRLQSKESHHQRLLLDLARESSQLDIMIGLDRYFPVCHSHPAIYNKGASEFSGQQNSGHCDAYSVD